MKKFTTVLAIVLAISMLAMTTVSAANDSLPIATNSNAKVYVDGTKEESGSGSKDSPFNNLVDAFAALAEGGGTIAIIGDTAIDAKLTMKKTVTDEDGNVTETDEFNPAYIAMPKHTGKVEVIGEGGKLTTGAASFNWENYGYTVYKDITISLGAARIMIDSFGADGHLVLADTCILENPGSHYMYCTGYVEYKCDGKLAHMFAAYDNNRGYKCDTIVEFGPTASVGTVWNGLGDIVNNSAYIVTGSNFTGFWGAGQAGSYTGSLYVYVKEGASFAGNAQSNKGVDPAKSFIIGDASGASNFKATAPDWSVEAVNANAALFNKAAKEYKVTGDVNSFVKVDAVAEGNKLFAIVDGAPVEIPFILTSADGAFFSTIEGATNYVFADDLKKEEPKEDPKEEDKPAKTADSITVIAVLAVISLAGAVVAKKVSVR